MGERILKAVDQRAEAILRRIPEGNFPRAAEVGVLKGALSERLLAARPGLRLLMVDNWLEAAKQPESYRATRDDAAHADAARAASHKAAALLVASRFKYRADVIGAASVIAAQGVPDGSLDLVFIDADHSEDGVRSDLDAWVRKVKPGGYIGGHDYGNGDARFDFSGVKRAVDSFFPDVELDLNFTWFKRLGARDYA